MQEFIDGDYDYEDEEYDDEDEFDDTEDNADDEVEEPSTQPSRFKQQNGNLKFIPHLAKQDQKREYFKDFRNTRDKALYTPMEKGARNHR